MEARALAKSGVLQVRWHDRLAAMPAPMPVQVDVCDKVEGMLLGLAIGDSLGNTSESVSYTHLTLPTIYSV